jgi:hypothetical protein
MDIDTPAPARDCWSRGPLRPQLHAGETPGKRLQGGYTASIRGRGDDFAMPRKSVELDAAFFPLKKPGKVRQTDATSRVQAAKPIVPGSRRRRFILASAHESGERAAQVVG